VKPRFRIESCRISRAFRRVIRDGGSRWRPIWKPFSLQPLCFADEDTVAARPGRPPKVDSCWRGGCSVEPVGRHGLEVNPRLPLLNAAAKLEIEGLLRVWRKLHPESSVNVSLVERVDAADRHTQ
jgi:hypothetical protein